MSLWEASHLLYSTLNFVFGCCIIRIILSRRSSLQDFMVLRIPITRQMNEWISQVWIWTTSALWCSLYVPAIDRRGWKTDFFMRSLIFISFHCKYNNKFYISVLSGDGCKRKERKKKKKLFCFFFFVLFNGQRQQFLRL